MSALELTAKDVESEGSKSDLNGEVHSIAGQWLALSLDSKKQTPTEVLPDGRVLFDGKGSLHTNFRFGVDTGIKPTPSESRHHSLNPSLVHHAFSYP